MAAPSFGDAVMHQVSVVTVPILYSVTFRHINREDQTLTFFQGGCMSITRIQLKIVPMVFAGMVLLASVAMGETTKTTKTDTSKSMTHQKQLKPQTTCPVTGDPIDKKLYVDYQGKRIYVCCQDCITAVKKDPGKYIKKLESEGQGVEENTTGADMKTGTSMKNMDMKMKSDTSTQTAANGFWTCSMHPEIHEAGPGSCPKCGMKLIYKKSDMKPMEMKSMEGSKKK